MTSGSNDHEMRRELNRLQKRIDDLYTVLFLILGLAMLLGLLTLEIT